MKIIYAETRYIGNISVPEGVIAKLPEKVILFMTLQFIGSLDSCKRSIEDTGRKVIITKGKHTKYIGQIYGCNLEHFAGADAYLYIGDGLFHPKALMLGNNLPVHVYNPINDEYKVYTRRFMESELSRQKAAYAKFLSSGKIGVILSTKMGQSYPKLALRLKDKYPDKTFFYIVFDTVNLDSLEDFNFIQVWVNTACPRLGWDDTKRITRPMVDLGTVL
ncbi:MAG: hypothetical protein HGA85_07575 [Nanoarchaeota archaeon]|nr:hypothetical protein [Nanoarchaeota archaeon]